MSQSRKEEQLDIKAIDSFLIVIKQRNPERKASTSSSNNEANEQSKILGKSIINDHPSLHSAPTHPNTIDCSSAHKVTKQRSQLIQNLQKCQEIRLRYESLLKGSPVRAMHSSSDKISKKILNKKEEVRYLNYTESSANIGLIKHNIPEKKIQTVQISGYPQLRIQPFLLSVYSNNSCLNFYLLKLISKGPKNQLFLSQELNSKLLFSLRMFKKQLFTQKDITRLIKEIKMQNLFNHPNIVKLYHFLSDQYFFYALYQPGLHYDLATKLKENGPLTEKQVRGIVRQIGAAIQYMHKQDILHLKLRLENVHLQEDVVKVAAFDQSVYLPLLRSQRPPSQPPKHITSNEKLGLYDTKIDIWDIGILTYELMFGKLPIFLQPHEQISSKSIGIYFPEDVSCTPMLKEFIEGCLQQNPSKRFSIRQMNQHSFLRGGDLYRWTMM